MASSVAGQIRIDLLTNAAQFNSGMREAGREGFGSFRQEAEKFDRWFSSRKETAKRESGRENAWQQAIAGAGGPLWNPSIYSESLRGTDMSKEQQTLHNQMQNAIRMKDALPWGTSMRTTMSREAMLTAVAIGEAKQTVVKGLSAAARDIAGEAANAGGLGGLLGTAGRFAAGHPVLTGVGLTAGATLNQVRERDQLARDVKRDATILGQGAEDTSRLRAVGFDQPTLSKFQRALSEQSAEGRQALGRMGLNADALASKPLLAALTDLESGFDGIKNPADKANAAMALFGRGGAEMIATLAEMREKMQLVGEHEIIRQADIQRTEAWEHALKGAKNTFGELWMWISKSLGGESGIGTHMARSIESMKYLFKWDWQGFDKAEARWKKEDYNIAHADEIKKQEAATAKLADQAERYAAGMAKARDTLKSLDAKILDLEQGEGASARADYLSDMEKNWVAGGRKPGEVQRMMEAYDARQARIKFDQDKKKGEELYKSAAESNPQGRYDAATREIDYLYNYGRLQEDQYAALKLKYLRDYYREAEGLDAEAIRKRLGGPQQEFSQGLANLRAHGQAAGLTAKEVEAEAARRTQEERKRLGVKDPLLDYGQEYAEHARAVREGTITREELDKWNAERRKSAVSELVGETPEVRLNAAMAAGGSEAHSLIARAATADPRTKAALDAVAKLDRIAELLASGQQLDAEMLRAVKEATI